jgi:AraC family transcriptional regulator of adaptative response / DNA-3-methyladenine glycosylase II
MDNDMTLDADTCYRALTARDARFDGRFFVAVTTTGIYCRPVCRARTPGRERCQFYRSAAEAERAGFRACFRCRPESAPGHAPLDALPRLVARGLHRIDEGFLNDHSVEDLAAALGVTSRHLRRAFETVMGVTPIELAQSRRLALAKQLLHETSLGVADVAFASGFRSLRRFNASFHERFGCAPSRLRGPGGDGARGRARGRDGGDPAGDRPGPPLRLRLEYREPFAWPALLAFLRARAIPGVEHVTGDAYQRTVAVAGQGAGAGVVTGLVTVRADATRPALVVEVAPLLASELMSIATRLRRLFDLDADPLAIAEALGRDPWLGPRVAAHPGLRVPGAFDAFELVVRAVLGQQVSVRAATTLAGRLVARFGTPLGDHAAPPLTHVFPRSEVLARASVDDVAAIGMPATRAAALIAVARACAGDAPGGKIVLEPGAVVEDTLHELESLPGIGAWTAQYIAMRALHWPDAFPASDLAIRKALGRVTARQALVRAEPWRPWRAYAVMHLWHSLTQGIEP